MKSDVTNLDDIKEVVYSFYEKVKEDDILSIFFSEIVNIDWESHLPLMIGFWENVLFYTGDYEGNPLDTHRKIHKLHPTNNIHFNRWLRLFENTIDKMYVGENANKMKQHSRAIAEVMLSKI
ncbi:MAG: group III truncated hemoglobin [Moheibacter sp.]